MNGNGKSGPGKFDYSNCWEDAEVLLTALGHKHHDKLLAIAGAGDNCLSLLTLKPREIIALDHNPLQLACLDLKMAAIRALEYMDCLAFLGIKKSRHRLDDYTRIRRHMSPGYRKVMDTRKRDIARGIIFCGKLEFYLGIYSKYLLPLLWRKPAINRLFLPSNYGIRKARISRELKRLGWKMVFAVFFSRPVISLLGRDRKKFHYVQDNIRDVLAERIRHILIELPPWQNPYLNFIMRGNFEHVLPHYLKPGNYTVIKKNLDRIRLVEADLAEYLARNGKEKYSGFVLSDIFEYLDTRTTDELFRILAQQGHPGARLVYWNMMVPRKSANRRIRFLDNLSRELFLKDRVMFYRNFFVEEVV